MCQNSDYDNTTHDAFDHIVLILTQFFSKDLIIVKRATFPSQGVPFLFSTDLQEHMDVPINCSCIPKSQLIFINI